MTRMNPLADVSDEIVSRLPRAMVRDLRRHMDRSIRDAADYLGAPHMDERQMVFLLGVNGAAETQARELARMDPASGAGAVATGGVWPMGIRIGDPTSRAIPLSAMPGFMPGNPHWARFGSEPPPMQTQPEVRRIPYVLYGETTLTAGVNVQTFANANQFINGTPYRFIVTSISMSEGVEPVSSAPDYKIIITPNNPGKSYSKQPLPATSALTGMPYGPLQNSAYARAVWKFDGPFFLPANAALYCEGTNPGSETVTLALTAVGYKTDSFGTPRLLSGELQMVTGTAGQPFNISNLTMDGDADLGITRLIFTGGSGNWGMLNPVSPQILIRPNGSRFDVITWTGYVPCSVIHMNNTQDGIGSYWRLDSPTYIPPGTTVQVGFQNTTAEEKQANIAFVGYLEANNI